MIFFWGKKNILLVITNIGEVSMSVLTHLIQNLYLFFVKALCLFNLLMLFIQIAKIVTIHHKINLTLIKPLSFFH